MRIFLWVLALFALAVGLAVSAHFNVGNVVFFYPPYRIDMSFNLFLFLLIAVFFGLYAVIRVIRIARRMPARVEAYRKKKRENEANVALREAVKALYEGRFVQAEKSAEVAAALPENAGCAALLGARAAHAMRQHDRRNAWLAKIEKDPAFRTARLTTKVELLVDDHQTKAALEAVGELTAKGARHVHALRLALKANQQAKNWDEVLKLVKTLDKHDAVHPALSSRLRELAYEDMLSSRAHDAESVRRVWNKIPSDDRKRPYVAVRAARAFSEYGLHDDARSLVARALQTQWDERLLRSFRDAAAEEGTPALRTQIEQCEEWAKKHPTDPELALTLGALCLKQKLWGKAQVHLEHAVSGQPDPQVAHEGHYLLAQMHERLNRPEEAARHYRQCALASKP
ncbi:MAG: heme biosynthesis protein HemY [Oxalobacter sp.]|nr:MAG: heme biosynthesis protein HemY [Oxalobacter sp.]